MHWPHVVLVGHRLGMRWFTSDLHIGHANIIKHSDRPFVDVGQMNAGLVALWNSVVSPEDEVWVIGDIDMGQIDESFRYLAQLVGHKHLVLGNHDRPFKDVHDRYGWAEVYRDRAGFVELHRGEVELDLADGTTVRLCHFPYEGDSGDRDRFVEHRPEDDGRWLLHGHVHEKWRQRGRMINVGVDVWAGLPVSEDRLVEMIEAGEADLDRLDWTPLARSSRR